jgi:hypothetical protein
MTSAGHNLLLVGLKGSGKTTFLAALWHQLEAGEVETSLVAAALQPDRTYLNRIRDAWLSFQDVPRTSLQAEQQISLGLTDRAHGRNFQMTFPDPSGESFRLQWRMRRATTAYAGAAKTAGGFLLFLHPHGLRLPARLTPTAPALPPEASQMIEWKHEFAPTQVQVLELIQFALHLRTSERLPLAVVISAWDTVRDSITPAVWLERRVPLLWQYLTSNADVLPFRCFGVSALGGDLQQDHARLAAVATPALRVSVIEADGGKHNDLTSPIRFLVES